MDQTPSALKSQYGLAGKTVLAAMKDLFDKHVAFIDELAVKAGGSEKKFYGFGNGEGLPVKNIDDYIKYMAQCTNTGFKPSHWSDIQVHAYCVSLNARGCYTYLVAKEVPRTVAMDACASDDILKWRWMFENPSRDPAAANPKRTGPWDQNIAKGALDYARFYRGVEFEDRMRPFSSAAGLTGHFDLDGKEMSHTDVFRYLMAAKTFAFPDDQQNRVINEFWAFARNAAIEAADKAASGTPGKQPVEFQPPTNVSSAAPDSCKFREARYLSEVSGGNHCKEGLRLRVGTEYKLAPRGR